MYYVRTFILDMAWTRWLLCCCIYLLVHRFYAFYSTASAVVLMLLAVFIFGYSLTLLVELSLCILVHTDLLRVLLAYSMALFLDHYFSPCALQLFPQLHSHTKSIQQAAIHRRHSTVRGIVTRQLQPRYYTASVTSKRFLHLFLWKWHGTKFH